MLYSTFLQYYDINVCHFWTYFHITQKNHGEIFKKIVVILKPKCC